MSGLIHLALLLLPLLLSGAVIGAVMSSLIPKVFEKIKQHAKEQKIIGMYRKYSDNTAYFTKLQPNLSAFFEEKKWKKCSCPNCAILNKKLKKLKI